MLKFVILCLSVSYNTFISLYRAIPPNNYIFQMFSRFGKILALTMTLSLVYTLFMAGSLLAVFAPTTFAG